MCPIRIQKPRALRILEKAKQPKAPSYQKWYIGGAVVLAIVVAWIIVTPDKRESPMRSSVQGPKSPSSQNVQIDDASPSSSKTMQEQSRAFIKAVHLQPGQPTRMDAVRAEIELGPDAPERIEFSYVWKVNDRVIEGAGGDTLKLSDFKKGDLIHVDVTPNDERIKGYTVGSPIVAVHAIAPSLDLQGVNNVIKKGVPIELQLVSIAPDSQQTTFSLESPLLPGMTIDRHSGKISWVIQPDQKGLMKFGAAVEDDHRTKVTKIFEVKVD